MMFPDACKETKRKITSVASMVTAFTFNSKYRHIHVAYKFYIPVDHCADVVSQYMYIDNYYTV